MNTNCIVSSDKKSYLFCDLQALVSPSVQLSTQPEKDKWQVVPYQTAEIDGKMLIAAEMSFPKEVTLHLGVEGEFDIYLGLLNISNTAFTCIGITGNEEITLFQPENTTFVKGRYSWAAYEWIEESYYKTCELTGKGLILGKPEGQTVGVTAALAFIRLERAQKNRGKQTKNISYHFDNDYYSETIYKSPKAYTGRMDVLQGGYAKRLVLETSFDLPADTKVSKFGYVERMAATNSVYLRYLKQKEEVRKAHIDKAHSMGMQLYAGFRIEMGDFFMPYNLDVYNHGDVKQLPDMRCKTRDGRTINALSYAYPEVRKRAINMILRSVKGFDGVSLFFHRGILIGHEQPVCDMVQQLYGVDACKLPFADVRLNSVLSHFMTLFLRELKAALTDAAKQNGDPLYKIDVVPFYDPQSSKNFGTDTEAWAKEKLIDSISQGLMKHYESLENCMDDSQPDLIDLKKYTAKLGKGRVLERYYDDDAATITNGAAEFLRICKAHGIEFLAALAWENKPAEYQTALAAKLYAIGVENLFSWNANHICKKLPVINAIKQCGDKQAVLNDSIAETKTMHRVLSILDEDISTFNINWRG